MNDSKAWSLFLVFLAAAGLALVERGAPAQETAAGFRVIVHAQNSTPSATPASVSRWMLKKSMAWADGTPVEPVDLDERSALRDAFSQSIHGRSPQTIVTFWQRQVFSGRDVPPPVVATDDAVVAYVRRRPGAIGYVSTAARLEGVRELTVDR